MNKRGSVRCAGMLATLLLLSACASMRVGSDQYPGADFSAYRTYAWVADDPLISPRGAQPALSALTVRLVQEAVEAELGVKGYIKSGASTSADFVLAFTVGARDRLDAESYPLPYRGPWQRGWSWHDVDVQVYREGTLSIDIFDGKERQPVWHGWAKKTITSEDESDPGPVIRRAVAQILRQFPSASP